MLCQKYPENTPPPKTNARVRCNSQNTENSET